MPRRFLTREEFEQRARAVHGDLYRYANARPCGIRAKLAITCRKHGDFLQRANSHLDGSGCEACAVERRTGARPAQYSSLDEFLSKAKAAHGDLYDYSKVVWIKACAKITIICRKHGEFIQRAKAHARGQGCPECRIGGHSKVAIQWIEQQAKALRLKDVWHAENGGEFLIPGTRFSADGYHWRTKTIFEFYGDAFHGNPNVFKPDAKPNPYSNKTAKELYRKTMQRESQLRSLGYRVISIWESEYHRSKKS